MYIFVSCIYNYSSHNTTHTILNGIKKSHNSIKEVKTYYIYVYQNTTLLSHRLKVCVIQRHSNPRI